MCEGQFIGDGRTISGVTESPADVDLRVVPMLDYLARMGRRASESGSLRPRHVIALTLLREQGACGQQTLAETLSLDPSNVVGLLNELEDQELVTRRRDPADRRRHIVELSARGEDALREASSRLGAVEDHMFSALSGDERRTLHELLSRVVASASVGCPDAEAAPPASCPG
jgi:MarR family transcriptional regulator, transcriptional regulator for hemolysin